MDEQWINSRELKTPKADSSAGGGFFKKLYNGEYSLARTFWLCYFLVSFLIGLLQSALAATVMGVLLYLALSVIALVYGVICVVGIWRAASKYTGLALWAILAKIYVVLSIICFVIAIVGALFAL